MARHVFYHEDFPDLLRDIRIGSKEIEATIKVFSLQFPSVKNEIVEWKTSFPPFADVFFEYIISENTIPEQEDFFSRYVRSNPCEINKLSERDQLALKSRAFRTYASLVRDIHFNKYVKENLTSATVIYNTKLDITEGIDLMISAAGLHCAVNLYTNTKRARVGRDKKGQRHQRFENVTYLDLPLDLEDCLQCGDFFLYGSSEFHRLENLLTAVG